MKKHPCLRTCVVALLTVTLSVACVPSALALAEGDAASSSSASAASASSAATYEKSEVVYATLAASGAPKAVYVVNRFDVEVPGTVVDHGDYTSVQNLTNETELARIGDATTFEAEAGTLYYQGDAANAALPWNVSLSYELDGKKMEADQLAGASGNLAVHVTTARNEAIDPAFYDSFMLQITFTLPGDVASDVEGEGATIAQSGEDDSGVHRPARSGCRFHAHGQGAELQDAGRADRRAAVLVGRRDARHLKHGQRHDEPIGRGRRAGGGHVVARLGRRRADRRRRICRRALRRSVRG